MCYHTERPQRLAKPATAESGPVTVATRNRFRAARQKSANQAVTGIGRLLYLTGRPLRLIAQLLLKWIFVSANGKPFSHIGSAFSGNLT